MKNAKKTAELCLYGTRDAGFGWIARTGDGVLLGDGELRFDSVTVAVWTAQQALTDAGAWKCPVVIFEPGGRRMARSSVGSVPSYGLLVWETAPVFVISAEAIVAAASAQ